MKRTGAARVHSGVRRSFHFRVFAFVIALLGSLSAPTLALTHGLAHEHLANEHRDERHDEEHTSPQYTGETPAVERHSADEHAHQHATGEAVLGSRHSSRLDLTTPDVALVSTTALAIEAVVVAHAPALADHALLARPDPGGRSPPNLRAPPIR
jgi:hypothetical protein